MRDEREAILQQACGAVLALGEVGLLEANEVIQSLRSFAQAAGSGSHWVENNLEFRLEASAEE